MKRIIVTGGSNGLGLEIVRNILEGGDVVYNISRSISNELNILAKKYKNKLININYDLADTKNIREEIFKSAIGLKTPVHGLVNNAAMAYDDIITNLNDDKLLAMYNVNVFSPMILTKYVIRQMLLHKISGSIIQVSSISVHTGYKGLAMYASTKGALEAFSKNTAREWGERGIRSNALVAGFMETSMSSTLSHEQKNRIYNRTSLKSATSVHSVAKTVLFLLSEQANSITGQNIHVDSGTI